MTKLNVTSVREIRRLAERREATQRELAKRFNVSLGLINMIVNWKLWRHLR